MQHRQVFLHLLTPWHCCKVHCCRLLHSRSSVQAAVSKQIPFQISPQQSVSQCQCRLHLAAIQLQLGENAGPLQQFWPWPCTDNYVWLCLLITLSPGSATSWASLFSLQPKQLSEVFLFLLPMFPKSKIFQFCTFSMLVFVQIFQFSENKWLRSDPRCLKAVTQGKAVSNCYIGVALWANSNGWGFNIHDAAKR